MKSIMHNRRKSDILSNSRRDRLKRKPERREMTKRSVWLIWLILRHSGRQKKMKEGK